ncbi:spore coat protein A [Acrocarpospora pleiomorpha]|uniref:Spore coat protein A n=1 Tax=Acrocarpospora pleiomorpha TaxID=90975 RepID=A0A5M3XYD4_9ACTN|nr:multicopper oxidase family protein [Acrocarpospora pleiomorpha]GES26144.1 spore coat protein A [Acrocarpospora pleiomorpha]
MSGLSRHRLLVGAALGAGVLGLGIPLTVGVSGSSSTGTLLRSRRALPAPFTRRLTVPPVLRPTSVTDGERYDVVQRVGQADILDGVSTPIWGYNGIFPRPTLRTRRGRPVTVTHRNELPVPTVVHLHGGHTPAAHDGYPTDFLLPEAMRDHRGHHAGAVTVRHRQYEYPMNQPAATLWYHDHRMDFTGPGVWRGLAGFHLITDDEEEALPLPSGPRDLPLMIADRAFDRDGSLLYPSVSDDLLDTPGVTPPYQAGVLGDVILVNGQPWPVTDVDGARYRLRLLNASNARRYRLRLDPPPPGGGTLVQIASDGGLLPAPITHDHIDLAPAERMDVIVDFSRWAPGQRVTLINEFGDDRTGLVMRFRVGDRASDDTRIPERLAGDYPTLLRSDATVTRSMVFQSQDVNGTHRWLINGEPYHPDHIHARPRLGSTEIWQLVGDLHHPVHLHLSHFQVLARGTGEPRPTDHGWKDTLDLLPGELAEIIIPFADYPGTYVFHCHNLEHEDMMMMGNFSVT